MRLGWWPRDGPLFLVPRTRRGSGALLGRSLFLTLHGVVFAILGPGSAVQRPPRPGHETVNASRLATRRFNSKPSCSNGPRRLERTGRKSALRASNVG